MMCKGRSWIEGISVNSLRKIEAQIGTENTDVRTENMGKISECVHIYKKRKQHYISVANESLRYEV
jgi:hypothetical protein